MTDPHGGHDVGHGTAGGHGGGHGGADDHAEALGPVDLAMWGVGVLGVAVGLLVCLCFAFATGVL
jgi:hypothetical protein